MRAVIKFKKDSPYYRSGEEERTVENLTEVHYCYVTAAQEESTAFESDIDGTGFTIKNRYIKEFEVLS